MGFEIGDVVSLKSGGAKMTVESASEQAVACVWSDGKRTHKESFHPAMLTKGATIEELLEQLDEAEKHPKVSLNIINGPPLNRDD